MSQFYARYIPPSVPSKAVQKDSPPTDDLGGGQALSHNNQTSSTSVTSGAKRQRDREEKEGLTEHKKRKTEPAFSASEPSRQEARERPKRKTNKADHGTDVLAKYSVSKAAQTGTKDVDIRVRRPGKPEVSESVSSQHSMVAPKVKRTSHGQNLSNMNDDSTAGSMKKAPREDQEDASKHAGILSKYAKSREKAVQVQSGQDEHLSSSSISRLTTATEQEYVHGLEPLPQAQLKTAPIRKPSYSTLPPWLANPILAHDNVDASFESLDLSPEAISNLRDNKIEEAFPIQSAVFPLLGNGPRRHDGDICISAATGSGKTLAYVLPVVEALKPYVVTKLRGLIVVPTRELVKQVRESFDLCVSGTNLKVVTALGSKSLAEEQDSLVEQLRVYRPEEFRREQRQAIDWSTFSLDDVMARVEESASSEGVGYVKRYVSKADVLICTPGRLVDHLRSTTGFTLDDVTWLVIDEADRLLNESYQEWIEVVMPALESTASTELRDNLLRHMRLEVPPRRIRKVALSATMTQDISKLNSLNLRNPKLVILGDGSSAVVTDQETPSNEAADIVPDTNGVFKLPLKLSEWAVSCDDGAEKPLFLLKLLQTRTMSVAVQSNEISANEDETPDSGSSTSSDDSDTSDSDTDQSISSASSSTLRSSPVLPKEKPKITKPRAMTPRALIFTRSSESATRLTRLLSLLIPSAASQISTLTRSSASSSSSRKALAAFRSYKTNILIATDRASRGLDVPDLEHVISYDIPASASTYVHRVGRTARAGKHGHAWTLVAHREARWFWKEIGGKNKDGDPQVSRTGKVQRVSLSVDDNELKKRYEDALERLGTEVKGV